MAAAATLALHTDLSRCLPNNLPNGLEFLPTDVASLHEAALVGPFLLQISEAVDLTLTDEERRTPLAQRASKSNRMLKLHLTDGRQSVSAIEYRRVPNLADEPARGTKLLVSNVAVRRGLLLLCPACASVVGGMVRSAEDDSRIALAAAPVATAAPAAAPLAMAAPATVPTMPAPLPHARVPQQPHAPIAQPFQGQPSQQQQQQPPPQQPPQQPAPLQQHHHQQQQHQQQHQQQQHQQPPQPPRPPPPQQPQRPQQPPQPPPQQPQPPPPPPSFDDYEPADFDDEGEAALAELEQEHWQPPQRPPPAPAPAPAPAAAPAPVPIPAPACAPTQPPCRASGFGSQQ